MASIERKVARKPTDLLPQVLNELFKTALAVWFVYGPFASLDLAQNQRNAAARKLLKYSFSFGLTMA
jgi:hypothetical protein